MKYLYKSALLALITSATVQAQEVTIDLAGIQTNALEGDLANVVLFESLPAGSIVNGVTWTDVTASGLGGPSWGQEMTMDINGELDVVFFQGELTGDWGPASGSAGLNFTTDTLRIEFYESFNDGAVDPDAEFTGGSVTITYGSPEDCNGNGVPDGDELGPDTDCDNSGVLDACEGLADCDLNGVPDICEPGLDNDLFENATPMELNGQVSGSTTCALPETDYGVECNTNSFTGNSPDVFFSIELLEAGEIDLWTCDSSYDTDLSIHNLDGTIVVCDGDGGDDNAADGCQTYSSRIITQLPAGDYVIRIGGWNGAAGDFVLDSSFVTGDPCDGLVPANDLKENAIPMPLNGQITGTNVCAGSEAEFGADCNTSVFTGTGPDVFYSLEITESTTVILSTCASDYDTDLSIHDADGNILVCDGDSADPDACTQYTSVITATLEAGNYLVRLGGWNGAEGNFVLDSSTCSSSVYNVSSAAEVTDLLATIDACGDDIINWAAGTYDFGGSLDLGGSGFIHRGAVDASGDPATIITGNGAHQCLNSFGSGAFENFVFENGRSGGDGGAFILAPTGKVTFENCVFRNNVSGGNGGAVCNLGAQNGSEFINCVFLNNSGNDAGAAFANGNGADGAIFTSCEFIGNTAANTGGGICTAGGDPTVVDCVFTNNAASSGGGIYVNGNPFFGFDTATVSGTTFCDNDPDAYAGPGIFDDQGGNEFACDEPACPEDVDENGSVDFADILAVLSAWGTDDAAADVDENGTVDFADVLALLSAWGSC